MTLEAAQSDTKIPEENAKPSGATRDDGLMTRRITEAIDKMTKAANEIANRAIGRVLSERDMATALINKQQSEICALQEQAADAAKTLAQFKLDHANAQLKMIRDYDTGLAKTKRAYDAAIAKIDRDQGAAVDELDAFRSDVAFLRDQVGALTATAAEASALIGEVVMLKSGGGPQMTAAAVTSSGSIMCFWMGEGDPVMHSQAIPAAALVRVGKTQTTEGQA